MKLKIVSTGSEGNMYVLSDSKNRKLILEAGLSRDLMIAGLDYDLNGISGLCLSHEHEDHSKSAKAFEQMGVSIITHAKTALKCKLNASYNEYLEHGQQVLVGSYYVMAFNTYHNCEHPLGFIIHHDEMGTMVFATDTSMIPNKFNNVNHWLIEANYSESNIDDLLESGNMTAPQYQKTKTHLSIEAATDVVLSNGIETVNNVVLCHTSLKNACESRFTEYFSAKTGIMPKIAQPNMTIRL